MTHEFEMKINEVSVIVEYSFSGFGGDAELDELGVFIGDQCINDIVDSVVMRKIEDECVRRWWDQPEMEYEPDFGDEAVR